MLMLCVLLCSDNQVTVDQIPDFKTSIGSVKSKTDSIGLLIALQKENTKGTAAMKQILKSNLAAKMVGVSDPFAGYAAKTGNMEWYVAFNKLEMEII
jgi:hypothetical protein